MQIKQLLSRVLFHLANSSVKCLIWPRQVLTALFKSNKAVQIQNNASLIYNYMKDKEISYSLIWRNGAKIKVSHKESSPRSSYSALRCSTTKLQRILCRASRAITAFQCNTRLGYSRSIRVHYRQQTEHNGKILTVSLINDSWAQE